MQALSPAPLSTVSLPFDSTVPTDAGCTCAKKLLYAGFTNAYLISAADMVCGNTCTLMMGGVS
jgi:hypothetical protein